MEDTDNNVFIGRNDIILTKQVLSNELVDDIMKHISTCEFNSNFTKLATRHILPDDLPSELYDNINNEIILYNDNNMLTVSYNIDKRLYYLYISIKLTFLIFVSITLMFVLYFTI